MPVPFRPAGVTLLLALLCALPACADAISDSIAAAQSAYAAGDLKKAGEDLRSAQAQLQAMQGEKLAAFLPEAPESWTRTVSTDMGAGLAILGGGSGAEARYAGSGESFTITITADNPMVTGMGAMLSDESMIASIGKLTRIADRNFVDQDGSIMGMIGSSVMVSAEGASVETMLPILERIDFTGLEAFGS